ncbi:MAG: protein tyrosine phosphatase [Archangiaceae bacterium]|nr:protein tyrosine phosphatase [Archangiaceae bacterium]
MFALVFSLAAAAAPLATPAQADVPPKSVYDLDGQRFLAAARHDLETLKMFAEGLHRTAKVAATDHKALFGTVNKATYSAEQKALLLSTWGALFSYFSSIEALRQRYWDFVKLPPTDARHAWGFLLTHTALTSELSEGLSFADLTQGNPQLETLFDEPNADFGVPAGSYGNFKLRAIHVATSAQLITGETWTPTARRSLDGQKVSTEKNVAWALGEMASDTRVAKDKLNKRGVQLFFKNALDIVKDSTAQAIFPAQKTFAEWAGDTRVARIGQPLLTLDQCNAFASRLLPGDIAVSRQNWFLSNIALPGFWPHAMLYLGTAKELGAYFDADDEVKKWALAQTEKADSFSALLERRYPEKWKLYSTGRDLQGHAPIRVLESISEGVSFTAFEHAFGVDYLGVMRPRLSKLEKARAIEHAFKYQGRPYDFDFDFFSDSTLVCTELVYKSYAPASDQKGLKVDLVDVAGRRTLPANELVKLFDTQLGAKDQQLDFVLFMDGNEKQGLCKEGSADDFRKSWQRMKWDIAQK